MRLKTLRVTAAAVAAGMLAPAVLAQEPNYSDCCQQCRDTERQNVATLCAGKTAPLLQACKDRHFQVAQRCLASCERAEQARQILARKRAAEAERRAARTTTPLR